MRRSRMRRAAREGVVVPISAMGGGAGHAPAPPSASSPSSVLQTSPEGGGVRPDAVRMATAALSTPSLSSASKVNRDAMPRTPPDGSSSPLLSANRDAVSLSTEARRAAERFRARGPESTGAGEKDQAGQPLTENQRRQLATLEEQDRAIRRHEEAHRAAAGGLVRGGISYRYRVGPDGKRYAVHGDVDIDLTAEASPEATIRKMQRARRAATAPASPSPQDRAIAALARQREDRAREALREERIESARGAREERSDAMRAEGDGASEAAGPGSGGEGAPEGLRALAALAAGLRPGQNPRTGVAKLADFTQGAAGPAEMARRLEALRQYQRASRPELFVAEGKAMQPARPHAVGGFVVTSLESPLHRAR